MSPGSPFPNNRLARAVGKPQRTPVAWLLILIPLVAAISAGITVVFTILLPFGRTTLAIAIIGSSLFLVAAIRYPIFLVFAIWGYESLLNWQPAAQVQLFGYNRLLFYAVMVGTTVLAVLFMVIVRGRRLKLTNVDLAILIYLLATMVTAITANDRGASFSAVTYLLATISVMYTTRLVVQKQAQLDQILYFMMAFFLAESVLGIYQFITGSGVLYVTAETGGELFRRATGTVGNGLGWYLDVGFIFAFSLWFFNRRQNSSRTQLLILCIISLGLIVANTRGAWIDAAMAVIIALWLGFGPALKIRQSRVLLFISLGFAATIILLFSSTLQTRVISIGLQLLTPGQTNVGFRFHLWQAALAMFREAPLFGVGPDNFRLLLSSYATPEAATFLRLELGRTYSPHHALLQILSESGALGAATFLIFVGAVYLKARNVFKRFRRQRPGLATGMYLFAILSTLAMFYGGYAFGDYTQIGRFYFVIVGLILAQHRLLTDNQQSI